MKGAFELGQRVTYSRTLHRTYRDGKKFWEAYDWADKFPANPELNGEGVVVGLRTLSNGTVRYAEEGTEYTSTSSFQAVMIAHHLRRKPVFVRLEHVVAS